jgi:hypothetical protein
VVFSAVLAGCTAVIEVLEVVVSVIAVFVGFPDFCSHAARPATQSPMVMADKMCLRIEVSLLS